tara:strand:- start:1810 stop:2685 length:876 start_codon:yes stop_codon:yes gene_type:complete
MKIVELILDETQEMMGIDAISIVESPAIQEDFIALNSQEIKLAEVSKEKKILMGALLVPNKPIYRKNGDDEYYIYFSKDTIAKASQLYLKNGYQGNSTLEHASSLEGLTLVESWLVEDEVNDKSRAYGMNVPVGTWMGSVKVDNDEIWNEYVKTDKVKGFSIEGYFADKMEKPKEEDMEEVEASQLLSAIEKIVRGEKVELSLISDMEKAYDEGRSKEKSIIKNVQTLEDSVRDSLNSYDFAIRLGKNALNAAKDLGAEDLIKKINATISDASVNKGEMEKIISKINSFII